MFGNFFGGMGGNSFEAHYRAMPVSFIDKANAENGDKVILPPSALDRLASLHVEYPMLFRVENLDNGHHTHCGVLEFIAEEGVVYMPYWMMQNLTLEVGQMVKFRNVSLPKGKYVKLQPSTSDFLDISNPKAVLERSLRSYSCLTQGDCIVIEYNNKKYEIEIRETKPGDAISVIETDCQVDFEAPKDYKEPERVPPPRPEPMQAEAPAAQAQEEEPEEEEPTFKAFVGSGRRLDGKTSTASPAATSTSTASTAGASSSSSRPASAKPSGSKPGTVVTPSTGNRLLDKLERERVAKLGGGAPAAAPTAAAAGAPKKEEEEPREPSFKPFAGKGYSLKG